MTPPDIATTLRKVSALRSLCLRLPHAPTPAETRLLERFEALAATPERAAVVDLDAIAAGWHHWWREGQYAQLLEMRSRLSSGLTDDDRDLSALAQAAIRHRWTELQMRIETCTACANLRPSEVSTPLRCREIPVPPATIKILFVGVAPTRLGGQSRGTHFYSSRNDRLRIGLFHALDRSPFSTRLVEANRQNRDEADSRFHQAGFFFVHACKIRPTQGDAPPTTVLRTCASEHLLAEIQLLQPKVVCLLGNTPGHLPAVARVLFRQEVGDVPERASLNSWTGLATVTAQPRRRGVPRAQRTLEAVWQALRAASGRIHTG